MAQVEAADLKLPWDYFLERGLEPNPRLTAEQRQRRLDGLRRLVEGFRRTEWPNIRREVGQYKVQAPTGEYIYWDIPEEMEPHWVEPGKAVYWQETVVRRGVTKTDEEGHAYRELEETSAGWGPTNPLPADNASQIARYLAKGLRLRPPSNGLGVEALSAAVLSDPPQDNAEDTPPLYYCRRHGYDTKGFRTWKAYLQHCTRYQESLEHETPPEVVEFARQFRYYCGMHNKGFNSDRGAILHIRTEQRRPRGSIHLSLDQMEVKRG